MSEQFRHRIGEEGVELILKESIRINLAIEDKKKKEEGDDRNKGNDGRGRKSGIVDREVLTKTGQVITFKAKRLYDEFNY